MARHICQAAPEELDSLVTYLQNAAPITLAGLQVVAAESDASAQQQQAVTVAAAAADNTDDDDCNTSALQLLCAEVLSEATQCEDINSDTASSRGVSPSPDDVADDVAHNVAEALQCRLQLACDSSSDQQEQLAVEAIVCDAAANIEQRKATRVTHSSDVMPANTSAGHASHETSQQSQQLQQPALAVVPHNADTANSATAQTDENAATQCSAELQLELSQLAIAHTDNEQQCDDTHGTTHGLSEATQHDVALYALDFLLSDVMYELVNDVADTALLQRRTMLSNAADYMNGPHQARLQQATQQCDGQLSVQQTLQQLQHCIDDAVMIEHSDVVAVVQHLKQQLEDMYTKNTGTLTDAQVLQVWSAAQREQGRAARTELAQSTTAGTAVVQQQRYDSSISNVNASRASMSKVAHEAFRQFQCSVNALSDRRICNGKETDVTSCAPPKQRRSSRFSAVTSQYSVLMGDSSGSSSRSSSSDSGCSSQSSSSNETS
jgi:hypothetical protein